MPTEHSIPEEKPRRTLIIVVALVAAVLIGGFFYLLLRGTIGGDSPPPMLQGAVRPGSPEWEQFNKRIVLDDPADCPEEGSHYCATESKRALGDIMMTLTATVRNFTGRTIVGLEVRGSVVDHDGKTVKERTVVIIPNRQAEIEPNKTMKASVVMDGFTETDDRADVRMEVTGFKLR